MNPATGSASRVHAFDALRACALLLGIAFHAAWSFIPFHCGAPIRDCSGNLGFMYFFFVSHMFRMQIFFVMAGFFARLVYQRRGARGFLEHRFKRIGLPLVIFWFVLAPLVIHAWIWGMLRSGVDLGYHSILIALFVFFKTLISGQDFQIMHLWFLYYLMIFYVAVTAIRQLFAVVLDRGGALRLRIDRLFGGLMRSGWSIPVLTLPVTLIFALAPWMGLDFGGFLPNPLAFACYFLCFTIGWLLHRQTELLAVFQRRWWLKLALGLALTVPMMGLLSKFAHHERYLTLKPEQGLDLNALSAQMLMQLGGRGDNPGKRLWNLLPEERQIMITAGQANTPEAKFMFLMDLNKILARKDFYRPADFEKLALAEEAQTVLKKECAKWSRRDAVALNRRLLEAAFPAAIPRAVAPPPAYRLAKLTHGFLYALVMWLFVFGFIGLFLSWFNRASAAWRYIADSSYWLYLVHLPIVANLQVALAKLEWPASVKFPLLLAIAFAIMIPSYHYMVRPTRIGVLLNGRRYATAHAGVAEACEAETPGAEVEVAQEDEPACLSSGAARRE